MESKELSVNLHAADIVARRVLGGYVVTKNRYGTLGTYGPALFAALRARHPRAKVVVL